MKMKYHSCSPQGKFLTQNIIILNVLSTKSCLFNPQVNNVSKMTGPIGTPGFNGSQGPAGPSGAIGPPGPQGSGNFSACQYKVQTGTLPLGNSRAITSKTETDVSIL